MYVDVPQLTQQQGVPTTTTRLSSMYSSTGSEQDHKNTECLLARDSTSAWKAWVIIIDTNDPERDV